MRSRASRAGSGQLRKFSFLTIFFTILGIVFVAAVWLRIRSYDDEAKADAPPEKAPASSAPAPATTTVAPTSAPRDDDPGIILPNATAKNTTRSGESERDRRFNQLLRDSPPAANGAQVVASTPVTPPAKPPAKERSIVTKIAEKQPPATPPPVAARDSPPQNASNHSSSNNSSSTGDKRDRPTEAEDDPDSDLLPPQLVAVDFNPPQVQDGEVTMLSVVAQDNLSGVRSVSGVIASPTGTPQGFACQRDGDSNRYIARISVPKEAAAGTWVVKYLTLTDSASNSVNLNSAQGALPMTASFRVVASTSDTKAPTLRRVWIDRNAMRAGDRNTVFVEADDEQTGVSMVNGVFVSPGKQARLAFGCRTGSTGAWECPLTPPTCLDCGLWHLEQLQLQDKANNMATVRADNPAVQAVVVDITGDACDANPPALSTLSLNPLVVSNLEGGRIEVRATIADDGCGVASLSGQAVPQGGVGGQHAYFSMQPAGDGRTFVGLLTIEKHAAKGTWQIAWLQALDKGHNLRAYAANDPIVSRVTFRVE